MGSYRHCTDGRRHTVVALASGRHGDAIEHALAGAGTGARSTENLSIAALAAAYAGNPDQASALNAQARGGPGSPTMRSWTAYVAGEIDSGTGRPESAEGHYAHAIELARRSGATFLVGVASVGLLAVRANSGRVNDALRGYADVIEYFTGTGNWTHLWTTLRNLASLLHQLGDEAAASLINTAADSAPDAPAATRSDRAPADAGTVVAVNRGAVLVEAGRAIERNLARL